MFYIYLRSYRVVRSFIRNICKFTFNFADHGPPFYITNYDVEDRRSFSFDTLFSTMNTGKCQNEMWEEKTNFCRRSRGEWRLAIELASP